MKRLLQKKEYFLIAIVIILFIFMSYLSLTTITQMSGNARVVNYTGIVRGATQRLIKNELYGKPNDALIARLDSIIRDLTNGGGTNELVVLHDDIYLEYLREIGRSWARLKTEIDTVRNGGERDHLYELSEAYFVLADKTVSAAERFSENQVRASYKWMLIINIVFVILILIAAVIFIRSQALKRKADVLGKLAYLDILTQMPNRASCEQEVDRITKSGSSEPLAVLMMDMNNIKLANDQLGHQGGDRIIADFARIIKTEAVDYGFIGRYGGDEFFGLFPNCSENAVLEYLQRINEKIVAYNLLHIRPVEKISFAVGYIVESLDHMTIDEMTNEADKRMYARKRQMKECKEEEDD